MKLSPSRMMAVYKGFMDMGALMRIWVVTTAICLSLFGLAAAGNPTVAVRKNTHIPAEGLGPALTALAKVFDFQVLYRTETVGKLRTEGASGVMTAAEALQRVLSGTGLTYRYLDEKTVTIVAEHPSSAEGEPAADAGAAGAGSAAKEGKRDSSNGFQLAQLDHGASSPHSAVAVNAAPAKEPALSGQLMEIIVTAQKRAERLQDIPVAVSVESGAELLNRGQSQLADYAAYMPGVNITPLGSPGQETVTLRGISSATATSAISTYLDDAPMGGSSGWVNASTTLLDLLPYDLDRVEILRGPQGTLYGAGSMGGLIKYVLKAPSTHNLEAAVGAEAMMIDGAGNLGYTYRARVNAPVIEDVLGVSFSVFGKTTPGYMTNQYNGLRDTNKNRQYGARIAALWTPSSELSVKLTALTQTIEVDDLALRQFANSTAVANKDGAVIVAPTAPLPAFTENVAFLAPFDQRTNFFAATVDWNAGPFDVVSATAWSSQRTFYAMDTTPQLGTILQYLGGTGPGLVQFGTTFGLDKFSQEFRLMSPQGNAVEWLVGTFVTHENSSNFQYYKAFNPDFTPMTGPLAYPPGLLLVNLPDIYDEYAAFGDLTWKVTDAFSLSGGARYSHNDQDLNWYVAPGPLGLVTGNLHFGSHEGVFTWMASAEYHFDKDVMAYARAATGYRPGGVNAPIADIPVTYDSDSLISYELGLKSTFLDHKAQIDLAVYHVDWKDVQLSATNAEALSYFTNGGQAVSQGVEFSATYAPIPRLTLALNAAYTNSHLTSVIAASDYLMTGYQLPGIPKESVSVTADYNWPLAGPWTAHVGGGYRYLSDQYLALVESASPVTTPTVQAPAYSVVDLTASIRSDRLTFKTYVRNLANDRAIVGGTTQGLVATNSATGIAGVYASFLQPRTVGFGVDYTF
jgi:iron complex outermembrane receptor protein